jgi:Domain of unknown function (DUF1772)
MTIAVTVTAVIGVAATAVIYGTDVFCALVLGPAANDASDRSVVELIGRVHHYGDRRLPPPGIAATLAAAIATAFADTAATSRVGAATALVALLAWLAIYQRVSSPVNTRLRAAAANHTVPNDTRALQDRWQSVIWYRAALQAIALAGLLVTVITR